VTILVEHAEEWYQRFKGPTDEALGELEAAREQTELITPRQSPIRAIRQVKENGEDEYLGDIGINRVHHGGLLVPPNKKSTEEEKEAALQANNALPVGHPDILFTVGGGLSTHANKSKDQI
jgi:hypothetical protein